MTMSFYMKKSHLYGCTDLYGLYVHFGLICPTCFQSHVLAQVQDGTPNTSASVGYLVVERDLCWRPQGLRNPVSAGLFDEPGNLVQVRL